MPTYEYACTDCGDKSEVVQRFSDDPLTVCSQCGGKLRKVFSPVGIVFKGSGFYRTDSRNGSAASAAKERGAKDASGSKAVSSGDSSSPESKSGSSDGGSSNGKTVGSDGSAGSASSSGSSGSEKKSSVPAP